jgi:putative endopeptidase
MKKIQGILVLLMTLGLASCADNSDGIQQPSQSTGIDITNLDLSVRPADDFYKYANGGWMAKNPLPPAYSICPPDYFPDYF